MFRTIRLLSALAAALLLGVAARSAPAEEAASLDKTVTIEGMHCPSCARKLSGKLKKVAGVKDVRVDAESGTAVVVPAKGRTVSPRALWVAVERASYTPVRLVGPGGTFTKKPGAS